MPVSTPTSTQRLAARQCPTATPVMYQAWHDLLFLHWAWDPVEIQSTLPRGLHVDCFDNRAWIGIVPFWMDCIRPRGLPPVPGLSWFQELNLRTYVHDAEGNPGVWFYSLDCNQPVATWIARTFFQLNYQHARQTGRRSHPNHPTEFYSYRRTTCGESRFRYQAAGAPFTAAPDTLDFFLVERYRLFSIRAGQLRSGQVWHPPYSLQTVRVEEAATKLWVDQGFNPPERPADHTLASAGVSVSIFPLCTHS